MKKAADSALFPKRIRTTALRSRKSKVSVEDFGRPPDVRGSVGDFLESLPDILAAKDFKDFLRLVFKAREKRKTIIFALGAHVIKVGLNPVLIDLMKEGWVSCLALNGAGIIHDFELAFCGRTSEDVAEEIKSGRFGMAKETGEWLGRAIEEGVDEGLGLGTSVGRMIADSKFPFKSASLLGTAAALGIPVTVHVAIGTDTIHYHPRMSGERLGKGSLEDFFLFCTQVRGLDGGGAFINVGSAVILPEVFLKAVTFVRNQGVALEEMTTAVFDFNRHYRPEQNVTLRPLGPKSRGFYFIGHHEIMIPLLAAGLKSGPKVRP